MRKILDIFSPPASHWVGDGFYVRSLLSHQSFGAKISPFLILDYAAPQFFSPALQPRGVKIHPHRGFETVTIVYQGEVAHRDSTGAGGIIGPGDVQWMTAASGILHEEFHSENFTRNGGMLEMVQLWVNLPAKNKTTTPSYQAILKKDIELISLENNAGFLRIIAGDYCGRRGPAQTFTSMNVWDLRLLAGNHIEFSSFKNHSLIIALLTGSIQINNQHSAGEADVILFDHDDGSIKLDALQDAKVLILSGEPILEAVESYGPFVMNTKEEIRQAIDDYNRGRFGHIPK